MTERRHTDEQIGYLTGKVESINDKLDDHMSKEEEKIDRIDQRIDKVEAKLDQVLAKTQTVKGMLLLLKFIGSAIFFVMALKFGDIRIAWDVFKSSL